MTILMGGCKKLNLFFSASIDDIGLRKIHCFQIYYNNSNYNERKNMTYFY